MLADRLDRRTNTPNADRVTLTSAYGRQNLLSKELQLIVELCRHDYNGSVSSTEAIDWKNFWRIADYNGVSFVAYHRLHDIEDRELPLSGTDLENRQRLNKARCVVTERMTVDVSELFAREDIRCLVVKGPVLGRMQYGKNYFLRTAGDVDILVDEQKFDESREILNRNGYVLLDPGFEPHGRGKKMVKVLMHAFNYRSPTTGVRIDLHHRLSHNAHWFEANFDRLWQDRALVKLGDGEVATLGPADQAAYLCSHAADHNCFKLKWIIDAAWALTRLQHDTTQQLPPELRCTAAVPLTKNILARLYGCDHTAQGMGKQGRFIRTMTERAVASIEQSRPIEPNRSFRSLQREIAALPERARLARWFPATWHDLLRLLSDPRDTKHLGMGPEWQILYAMLGPLFSGWRWLTR